MCLVCPRMSENTYMYNNYVVVATLPLESIRDISVKSGLSLIGLMYRYTSGNIDYSTCSGYYVHALRDSAMDRIVDLLAKCSKSSFFASFEYKSLSIIE